MVVFFLCALFDDDRGDGCGIECMTFSERV